MIIILSPGGYVTGGTELLHQLGYKLNLFGFEACIYYYANDAAKKVTHPYLKKYSVPVIEELNDEDDALFRRFLPRFNTYHKQFFFSDNQIFVEGYTDQQMFTYLLTFIED